MSEAFAHPEHAPTWVAAIEGGPPVWDDLFTDADDPEDIMAGYERWLVEVRAEIAPERLIEWQPGDGWEPICRALGVPVPNLPFPHENSTADYVARAEIRGP